MTLPEAPRSAPLPVVLHGDDEENQQGDALDPRQQEEVVVQRAVVDVTCRGTKGEVRAERVAAITESGTRALRSKYIHVGKQGITKSVVTRSDRGGGGLIKKHHSGALTVRLKRAGNHGSEQARPPVIPHLATMTHKCAGGLTPNFGADLEESIDDLRLERQE